MTMIDNGLGLGMNPGGHEYRKKNLVIIQDTKLFGASPSPDCP